MEVPQCVLNSSGYSPWSEAGAVSGEGRADDGGEAEDGEGVGRVEPHYS